MTGFLTHQNNPALAPFVALLPKVLDAGGAAFREKAFAEFCEAGLPHRKVEAWKYTDVTKVTSGPFSWHNSFQSTMSAPEGIQVTDLDNTFAPTIGKDAPFAWLSRAFVNGGWRIVVPDNMSLKESVEVNIDTSNEDTMVCPSLDIEVGAGSRVNIVIRFKGSGKRSLTSLITNLHVQDNASVTFTKIRSGNGAHFSNMFSRQQAGSELHLFDSVTGGELTRNDLHAILDGEGAAVNLNGLYAVNGMEHVDNHTTVQHAVPNAFSRQLYKGIMSGRSRGVFNGRIVVDKGASGTDALQMNRNLLRDKNTKVDTKPQLEIDNDDVSCSHGATIGRLDDTALFYLESRGLERHEAESLLARGFAGEVINLIRNESVRQELHTLAEKYFDQKSQEVSP